MNSNAAKQARFVARKRAEGLVKTSMFVPRNMLAEWRVLAPKLAQLSNHSLVGITVRDDRGQLRTIAL